MRFCSTPRSAAMSTTRCDVFRGVMVRFGRSRRQRLLAWQCRTQTPHPRQISSRTLTVFRFSSGDSAISSAPTGQILAHLPQPVQVTASVWMMKFEWILWRMPNRLTAVRASQQQLQQLQMKLTPWRLFSPNWTRSASWPAGEDPCTPLCSQPGHGRALSTNAPPS